jgi:hypothetical protein
MVQRISRFRNPEFRQKLERARNYERNPGFRKRLSRAVVLACALFVLYYLSVSQRFLITQTDSPEVADVLKRMQKERVFYLIPKNHFLVLTRNSLLAAMQKELPRVRSIKSFKKKLPNALALSIETREALYVWQTGPDFFLLDQDGVIFQKIAAFSPETFSQILVTDTSGAEAKAGDRLAIERDLEFIQQIKNNWANEINQTVFASFALPGLKSEDLILKTQTGYSVYFDLNRSPQTQLSNFHLILSQEIKPETYSGLSYIDLRLPTTAYYCYKDAPCAEGK